MAMKRPGLYRHNQSGIVLRHEDLIVDLGKGVADHVGEHDLMATRLSPEWIALHYVPVSHPIDEDLPCWIAITKADFDECWEWIGELPVSGLDGFSMYEVPEDDEDY